MRWGVSPMPLSVMHTSVSLRESCVRWGVLPMPLPSCAQVVHGVGALLQGLITEPVQDLRDLPGKRRLKLPPPMPPYQVMQQHLQHEGVPRCGRPPFLCIESIVGGSVTPQLVQHHQHNCRWRAARFAPYQAKRQHLSLSTGK